MGEHEVEVIEEWSLTGATTTYRMRCSCGEAGRPRTSRERAQRDADRHRK